MPYIWPISVLWKHICTSLNLALSGSVFDGFCRASVPAGTAGLQQDWVQQINVDPDRRFSSKKSLILQLQNLHQQQIWMRDPKSEWNMQVSIQDRFGMFWIILGLGIIPLKNLSKTAPLVHLPRLCRWSSRTSKDNCSRSVKRSQTSLKSPDKSDKQKNDETTMKDQKLWQMPSWNLFVGFGDGWHVLFWLPNPLV